MAAYIFDDLLLKGIRAGQIPGRTAESRVWFRDRAKASTITDSKLMREANKERLKNKNVVGKMQFFFYDPKHKKSLPYYDSFPLIFKVGPAKAGFYGLNMHYLPLKPRAALMDALYDLTTNKKFDQNTKLKLSYDILSSASKFKWFKPAFKHYLNKHVRSRFLAIESSEWDIALFLPVAQWNKANQRKVWADSRKIANKK